MFTFFFLPFCYYLYYFFSFLKLLNYTLAVCEVGKVLKLKLS